MSLVLVTGGTGHLGRDLVSRLVEAGHRVRVLTRRPQPSPGVQWATGDLATGDGLRDALRGVHTVINAATCSPIARRGSMRPIDFIKSPAVVDVDGTARLLALGQEPECSTSFTSRSSDLKTPRCLIPA
ncbi:NAD-dependent epimerase/dehydratase family protein [Bradyrhizobium jicamae]|uniref:NAD-dependent epimerase/dehydratase family protein n=1 Tax=Bradyrhizobium jicamae TaxID=280332 RepID=A0ABS5FL35_9BRAD|nr:NAD-dependent epimerase/dehydratase family protein [Bradyrhizobium jicamae]MBR0797494.1 NAD-dependent epimerase/dehydratase family protein [Bradyrhizobium jicamae]